MEKAAMDTDKKEEMLSQEEITKKGNPAKPQGIEGTLMLRRMGDSHARLTQWALDFFEFRENDNVLDIGCGGGAALMRMSERIGNGHLTGVDYSPVSVQESREKNEKDIRSGKMEIVEASVEKLPFDDEQFDKITTVESFYFWPDPQENLKEVRRVLKKGGTFLLICEIYRKEGLGETALENIRKYQLFTPAREEFKQLLEKAGFGRVMIHTKEGEDWICVEAGR